METLGQLFTIGIDGLEISEEEKKFILANNIGGVILFSHNYESPAQLAELVNSIQALRDEYPLFISVDQEGGRVKRFKDTFIQLPPMLTLGELKSPKVVFEAHSLVAKELLACGVNVNFSPCCDIYSNPENKVIADRAFGTDLETVESNLSAAIRGLQTNGVIACAKHFPGHGDTLKDSHFHLPLVKKSLKEIKNFELKPFIKASKSRVEMMMMAHLLVDSIDPDLPTSLSPKAYKFLREELKFNKIIITDDMEMGAITKNYGLEEAAVLAINAGADIVEYRSFEASQKVFNHVLEALKKKEIKYDQIDEKVKRIYSVKKQYFSDYKPLYIPDVSKAFKSNESKNFTQKLSKLIK